MLFPGRQGENKTPLPFQINGLTHKSSGHISNKLLPCREDAKIRPTKGKRNPKALPFSRHNIGPEFSGWSQNPIGNRLAEARDHHPPLLMDPLSDLLKVFYHTKEVWILNDDRTHILIKKLGQGLLIRSPLPLQIRDQNDLLLFRVDVGPDDLPIFGMDGL